MLLILLLLLLLPLLLLPLLLLAPGKVITKNLSSGLQEIDGLQGREEPLIQSSLFLVLVMARREVVDALQREEHVPAGGEKRRGVRRED